jgi:hypothetical protein
MEPKDYKKRRGKNLSRQVDKRTDVIIRANIALDMILNGYTRKDIIAHGESLKWGVNHRKIDAYIILAKELLCELNKVSASENLAMITQNLWSLYRKNTTNPEFCRKVLMDIAKLRGLDQIKVVVDDRRDFKDLPDDALDKYLEERHTH